MYTFLICQDNSIIATEKDRIMEKSSLVDTLQFLVEKEYNGFDMREFDLIIEGYLPISHEIQVETLSIADDNYKNLYYAYQLPINSGMTKEAGDLQFSLSFIKSDLDPDSGKPINYVRRIQVGHINVLPVESWFSAPDTALTQLTQLYLQNQQNIMALRDTASTIVASAPNDIAINNNEIYLTHENTRIGNGISVKTLADAIDDLDGNNSININI